MTSEKALLKIKAFLAYEDFQEELKAIAKDWEVLKILKRIDWLLYLEDNKYDWDWNWYIDTKQSMQITKEEFEMIKEWIERK